MRWPAPSRRAATAGTDTARRLLGSPTLFPIPAPAQGCRHDGDPDLDQPGAVLATVKHKPAGAGGRVAAMLDRGCARRLTDAQAGTWRNRGGELA
jgi:hypothetical protein